MLSVPTLSLGGQVICIWVRNPLGASGWESQMSAYVMALGLRAPEARQTLTSPSRPTQATMSPLSLRGKCAPPHSLVKVGVRDFARNEAIRAACAECSVTVELDVAPAMPTIAPWRPQPGSPF